MLGRREKKARRMRIRKKKRISGERTSENSREIRENNGERKGTYKR